MRTQESLPQDTRNILGTNNIFDLKKEKKKERETKCYWKVWILTMYMGSVTLCEITEYKPKELLLKTLWKKMLQFLVLNFPKNFG